MISVSRLDVLRQCTQQPVACVCGVRVFVTELATGAPVNYTVVGGTFSSAPELWPTTARRGSTQLKGFVRFNAFYMNSPAPASVCSFAIVNVTAGPGYTLDWSRSKRNGSIAMPAF